MQYLRNDGLIYQNQKSYMMVFYQIMNSIKEIGSNLGDYRALNLKRELLNLVSSDLSLPL